LHPAEFRSFVVIENRPETAGRWHLAPAGYGQHGESGRSSPKQRPTHAARTGAEVFRSREFSMEIVGSNLSKCNSWPA
jgi:hypothetical protein